MNRRLAPAHIKLALWCETQGLASEAHLHFSAAAHLNPRNDVAWKHLGYVAYHGHWVTREQRANAERIADHQRKADQVWKARLEQWRKWLSDDTLRAQAEAALGEVREPAAVPSIIRVFAGGSQPEPMWAVRLLDRFNNVPEATRALARIAVMSADRSVRASAIDALRGRTQRDFVGDLVDQIQQPIQYRIEPVRGPGSPGVLDIDAARFSMRRLYDAPAVANFTSAFFGYIGYDPFGMPVIASGREMNRIASEIQRGDVAAQARDLRAIEERTAQMIATANFKAEVARQALYDDVKAIELHNTECDAVNSRVLAVLRAVTGEDFGDDADAWYAWWYDRLGYRYEAPPKVSLVQSVIQQLPSPYITSCFTAKTPVHTSEGPRPIESLHVGDRVLSQDIKTGELAFAPISAVYHNPPGELVDITLDNGETLAASTYHRFWIAGKGWAMARELKVGDALRLINGVSRISAVSAGRTAPLFNLDVDRNATFFVGYAGALVHDNTLPERRLQPFDAVPDLATIAR